MAAAGAPPGPWSSLRHYSDVAAAGGSLPDPYTALRRRLAAVAAAGILPGLQTSSEIVAAAGILPGLQTSVHPDYCVDVSVLLHLFHLVMLSACLSVVEVSSVIW